jgi:hypothetical protein
MLQKYFLYPNLILFELEVFFIEKYVSKEISQHIHIASDFVLNMKKYNCSIMYVFWSWDEFHNKSS